MKYTFKLSHKIVAGMLLFLLCALCLGGASIMTLKGLTAKMEVRNQLDEIISLGAEAQALAMDWLVHREELSMDQSGKGGVELLKAYNDKVRHMNGELDTAMGATVDEQARVALYELKESFNSFDRSFNNFQVQFNSGVGQVKRLREISVEILGQALSLQKSIERSARKQGKINTVLQEKVFSSSVDDPGLLAQNLSKSIDDLNELAAKRHVSAIMLNKPLGFQEMAKDFILYKDAASGSGLIVDIEKLMGIDPDSSMGASYPQFAPLFSKGREAKLFNIIVGLTGEYLDIFKSYYNLSLKMQKSMKDMDNARIALIEQEYTIRTAQVVSYNAMQERAVYVVSGLSGLAALIGVLLILVSRRIIINPLRRIIGKLPAPAVT
ncbi:hypothetical protein [Maridesulfovibrio sp.]|uniref:hypothetical protein n=1 Tax=Maridesulfovibrio sp. TaxID=2795000 RepID=UPI003B001CF6